jgi:hypothetical protein
MNQPTTDYDEAARAEALKGAERMALKLLDAIEAAEFIKAGRTEREIELDIRELAREKFGIERDWHKRIVRAGFNTLSVAADNPPIRRRRECAGAVALWLHSTRARPLFPKMIDAKVLAIAIEQPEAVGLRVS